MDYQGNYFPDEHDENESKTYRVIKGIFKWTMYGISYAIYAVLIFALILNRDSKILEKNYMAELPEFENVEPADIELVRINSKIFMNEDGSIQLFNVDYSEEKGVMELGIKFNAKKESVTNGERGDCIEYVLTDSSGKRYPRGKHVIDSSGRYEFARICFTGLDIDLDDNSLNHDGTSPNGKGKLYQLTLIRKSDKKELFTFDIYDNTVTYYKTDYNK